MTEPESNAIESPVQLLILRLTKSRFELADGFVPGSEPKVPQFHMNIRHALQPEERRAVFEMCATTDPQGVTQAGAGTAGDLQVDVTMQAVFVWVDEQPSSIEEFLAKGAPAIVWPFVRELIADLTARAGLGAIYMPLLNFSAMATRATKATTLEQKA